MRLHSYRSEKLVKIRPFLLPCTIYFFDMSPRIRNVAHIGNGKWIGIVGNFLVIIAPGCLSGIVYDGEA